MSEFLGTKCICNGKAIHIAGLSKRTIQDCGADHMGYDGYFVFETTDLPSEKGITILGKAASFEAGLALAELISSK